MEVAQMHCGSVRKKARHPTQYQTRKRVIKDVRINDEELNIEETVKGQRGRRRKVNGFYKDLYDPYNSSDSKEE